MSWEPLDLDSLPDRIWREWETAAGQPAHPWRLPALATLDHFEAALRTVVLRAVHLENHWLVSYTDVRSAKVRHIRSAPQVQWLFHDPVARIQVRASALSMLHHQDAVAAGHWRQVPAASRVPYCATRPPGSDLSAPGDAIAPELRSPGVEAAELEAGFENFAVLVTTVEQIEWLRLRDDGHRRAAFTWTGAKWSGVWLVP